MKMGLSSLLFLFAQLAIAQDLTFTGSVKNIQICIWDHEPISEHSPHFMCASVSSAADQNHPAYQYEVVFAQSMDVAWAQYPKLKGSEEGSFTVTSTIQKGHWFLKSFVPKP